MALGNEIVILVLLLATSAFFSASEVALLSLSRVRLSQMIHNKRIGAEYVKRLKDDPQRMLSTILIGNNVVNIAASAMATAMALRMFDNYAIGIATGVMTLLILIFAEITPKSIAAHNNESIACFSAPIVFAFSVVLNPVNKMINFVLSKVIKILGIKPKGPSISEEDIRHMISAAEEEGSIKESERKMIDRIFKIDDTMVREVCTPRADMVLVDSKATVEDVLNLVVKKNYSRIPVYEKNRDNIVGVVHVKDVIPFLGSKKFRATPVTKIMNKPFFVPETKKIGGLMRQFQKRKEHLAIIVDEHGAIVGLASLEDILEEIVGEIVDETEITEPSIESVGKNAWLVKGKTPVGDVSEKLKMKLKGDGYDTISGFVLKMMGKIPKEGDQFVYKKFKFTIKELLNNRIETIRIEKK